ncbi:uncharacterized protein K02A2.6-like [Pectinophora gossypiella]|uniref:uncharacterized protein K02A2.6-like n=1 Tax=Pectinophora gossypiella TaxID=13191 RepID=UPI00214E5106|nr:uncharacterized protein K02A2.6-like [Pectinophora gossypiella]
MSRSLSANFGILTSYDHNVHTWKTYKGRITQWFIANDINETSDSTGEKRRAILLSALTENTYKLASDLALPKELESVPYQDILNLLDNHFTTKRVGFSERHNFYAATQRADESHKQWAGRLRGVTAHCRFANVEEALRDRFILGMVPGIEKQKLYAQDMADVTLAKAVELAENHRTAHTGAGATARGPADAAVSPDEQLFKIAPGRQGNIAVNKEKVKCSVCGYNNHKSSECRYANYVCKKCNVKGHLRRMCRNKVNYVNLGTGAGSDDDYDDGKLFNIRSQRGEPLIESIKINGTSFKFEVDSGSAVTVISKQMYLQYFKDVPLSKTSKRLSTYTGNKIECSGFVRLQVAYADKEHFLDAYVVENGGPPLLGRDFISLFNLQLLPVNYCVQSDVPIEELQKRYPKLFSDKLGAFNKYKINLPLKEGVRPVFFKARPIAFSLRDKVGAEIDRLVEIGVLKPVEHAEYASPVVPVLKRNGSVRLCADYSVSINKQLIIEQYPLPTIKELFSKLYGGQQFTKLDLSMAYNQFLLDDESQSITCINTHKGLFKYTRLVFGLASAPAIFQRAMECVLAGMEGVTCLLDDILITGKNKDEHMERLHAVLQRLESAGLTLQKEKCDFFKNEVHYLGYIINSKGLKKSPEKVQAILKAPEPQSVNQLQSFLGLVNYYRNFVANASSILSPLYDLLKKRTKWTWDQVHMDAFKTIKKLLASEQVLTHYNQDAKLILTVDASPTGLGAILSQVDDDGIERPISFASRTLNTAEKHYSQIQKEATAIIFGVRRFHQYLYGRSIPFTLRTDHKPLISIFGPYKGIPEVSANRLQRYAIFLGGYNYVIEYIRSADNSADFLSRASLPEPGSSSATPPAMTGTAAGARAARAHQDDDTVCDRAAYVCFVVEGSMPVTVSDIRNETNKDVILSQVKKCVMNGWPDRIFNVQLKPYSLCKTQLSYENGCIMRGHKVVIPETLRNKVLSDLHASHLGVVKTKAEARARFWFPGIDDAIENMIGTCNVCIQLRPSPARAPISPWARPPQPFQRLHIDFLGPINGRTYLVIVDASTKWVEVYDMVTNTTTSAVIEKMCDCFSRFGLPNTIVSDNGTAFCSKEFRHFCSLNGTSHVTSPAYHPASNGQAESFVKIVKKGIKSSLLGSNSVRESKIKLLKYLMDYRNSIHSITGNSPSQLVFGRKLKTRLDLINPKLSSPSIPDSNKNVIPTKQCTQMNKPRRNLCFKKGDIVLYKKYTSKSVYKWGKGIVERRIGKVIYLVKDLETTLLIKKHVNQIVQYKGTGKDLGREIPDGNVKILPGCTTPPPPPSPSLSQPPPPYTPSSLPPLSSPSLPALPLPSSRSPLPPQALPPPTSPLTSSSETPETMTDEDNPEREASKGAAEPDVTQPVHIPVEDEFLEAKSQSDSESEPEEVPRRILRKRPSLLDFRKYF